MRARSAILTLSLAAALHLPAPPAFAQKQPAPKGMKIDDRLTEDDARDRMRPKSYHKLHVFKMQAGRTYQIDMMSRDVDSFLRLEDPTGLQVAFNDDRDKSTLDSRIVHTAEQTGIYRIIATTFQPNQTGRYILIVTELAPINPLVARAMGFAKAAPEERKQILDALQQDFRKRKSTLGVGDVQLVMRIGTSVEKQDSSAASEVYAAMGRVLRKASDKKVAQAGKMIEGISRRLKLPGNEIEVRGTTLDGKELDWSAYRGKVVLVDFWATWCPPCLKELPNIRKMYETYHKRGFEVVAISLDHSRPPLTRFLDREKLPWVCLYDEGPEKGQHPLAMHYGILAIPQAILVDREGRVVSMNARGPELGRLLEKYLGPAEK
jgi:peroxiredoxin